MKLKNLLYTASMFMAASAGLIVFSSNSGGINAKHTVGCGGTGCHGSSATTSALGIITGIPASGYVPGTKYTLTFIFGIVPPDATLTKAGFDLIFSGGTISNAPAGTMQMGPELHHVVPKDATATGASWTFDWTAPATATTTVNFAGNLVNNNTNESGDKWNIGSQTLNAVPASVKDLQINSLDIYPNPALNSLTIKTMNNERVNQVYAISILGHQINLSGQAGATSYTANVEYLAAGQYILVAKTDKAQLVTKFTKL